MPLTPAERERYDRDGFLVREGVLSPDELARLNAASEQLCADFEGRSRSAARMAVSSHYIFEPSPEDTVLLKWEPEADHVIQGIEPLVHLHDTFAELGRHPGIAGPSEELLGRGEIALFTEKLNVKRARVGGSYALHRDFPYWRESADEPNALISVWIALDDATGENGALEVMPGSHKVGDLPHRASELSFERNELDPARIDTSGMVLAEVPAGAAIFFGPHLVHRSAPNLSAVDRRALIYTYQPAGLRDTRDNLRKWMTGKQPAATS